MLPFGLERGYHWEYSASVQHELMEPVSVNAGFYRRNFYNLDVIDNQNLALTDWTPFTIATPTDRRLPLSGQAIEMFTLNQNRIGVATDNLRTFRRSTRPSTTASSSAPTCAARSCSCSAGSIRPRRRRQLRRQRGDRRPPGYRLDSRHDVDYRQRDRAEHRVPRLHEAAGSAGGAQFPLRPLPHSGPTGQRANGPTANWLISLLAC